MRCRDPRCAPLRKPGEMPMTAVTVDELKSLTDFTAHEVLVAGSIGRAASSLDGLLRFLVRYASWNGQFGSGVRDPIRECPR